jgi:hypothetical protein
MRHIIGLVMVVIIGITSIKFFNGVQEISSVSSLGKATSIQTGANKASQVIELSHNEHFYEDAIEVSVNILNPKDSIYYTLDGSQPAITSEKYSKPIEIKGDGAISTKVLRAIVVSDNREAASITHTYFVGKGVHERFSTMVVSLSTDPRNLFDYETGIFVEGKLRHDYILANPSKQIYHFNPANYNLRGRLYERPVYVEMFEANGKRVISQKSGIRTHGGWARSLPQKSIRLIARNEYEPGKGKFDYDFFTDDRKFDFYGSSIQGYDSLVLKNPMNYEGKTMLNSEVASNLARESGFHETLFFRPVTVFLNGEYYGFSFLEQVINEKSLQEAYDAPEPAFDIAGDGETNMDEVAPEVVPDLEALNAFAYKDLTNDQVYGELNKIIDIDNFLHYYALELYFENSDWPHNNMKRWRYRGDVSAANVNPYLDGRWRYIMYDLDRTFGFMPDKQPTLKRLLEKGEKSSPLFNALLKRQDVKQQFLAILSELASGVMAPENVEKAVDSLYERSRQEVQAARDAGKSSSLLMKDERMLDFTHKRWRELLPQVKKALGYTETFDVTIKGISKSTYPLGSTVSINPELSRYEVFDGWLVNGSPNSQEKLSITQSDAKDGQVLLEQLSHVELPLLQLIEVSKGRNRVTLRNNTNRVISTRGFYLTDDSSDLTRWAFTPMKIQPGETSVVVGKKILSNTELFTPKLNFNIEAGETIILSDKSGQVLDYRTVE